MKSVVNIMVGGPLVMVPEDQIEARKRERWVGVDYGATYLLNHGIVPALALGDFDSTSPDELAAVRAAVKEIKSFPPEKDFTDTQLGVQAALDRWDPAVINIFGATGGRLDQLLANLYLPLQPAWAPYLERIRFIDVQNVMAYYRPGTYAIEHDPAMTYLAFVSLTPVTGLTLPDEKYQLDHFDATQPISWSSNEFAGPVNHFSFQSGVVAVIQSRDRIGKPVK